MKSEKDYFGEIHKILIQCTERYLKFYFPSVYDSYPILELKSTTLLPEPISLSLCVLTE